jgi:phytoene synthase
VQTALTLYEAILDEIVDVDYDVLNRRVSVGNGRRLTVAARGWCSSTWHARVSGLSLHS